CCCLCEPSALLPLSLHDALPIFAKTHGNQVGAAIGGLETAIGVEPRLPTQSVHALPERPLDAPSRLDFVVGHGGDIQGAALPLRSEEHTSDLQSRENLVCRLVLE